MFTRLGRRGRNRRKELLFGCACCRRIWPMLTDERSRLAVSLSELHAEGLLSAEAMRKARQDALQAARDFQQSHAVVQLVQHDEYDDEYYDSIEYPEPWMAWNAQARYAALWPAAGSGRYVASTTASVEVHSMGHELKSVQKAQADLVREIFGNPYRHYPRLRHWSPAVHDLAEALVAGEDCAFALHDALLEQGQPKFAQHFRAPHHVRGCWVADRILGKERAQRAGHTVG
jgi:hypothetical protein